jgi:hypothetical protein
MGRCSLALILDGRSEVGRRSVPLVANAPRALAKVLQFFFERSKLTPTSLAIRHWRRHGLMVLPSKVRLKSVGKTGASENSRRAPTDVISRT